MSIAALTRPVSSWSYDAGGDLTRLDITEAASLVRSRQVSPVELTKACLARIEERDNKVNSFITVTRELALEQAKEAEAEVRREGWRGPLHGIPIAVKDNIDTAGVRTTSASAVYADRVPSDDAYVVTQLRRAGAILLGKLNMSECAWGGGGVHSYWGPVRNPWNPAYEAGGSSSGSAAAVAAGFCFGSLGTDSGGSIRIPAARCGVVGLKPTFGLVSNRGVMRDFESLMHVGTLGKTVLDAATLLQVISGPESGWSTCADSETHDLVTALPRGREPLRFAVPEVYCCERVHPEVGELFKGSLAIASKIGILKQDEVVVPDYSTIFGTIVHAELWANYRSHYQAVHLFQPYLGGTLKFLQRSPVSSADYVDACRTLQDARRRAADIIPVGLDLLIMPTVPEPSLTIEERRERLEARIAGGFNRENAKFSPVIPFNVLGLPAMSVPSGFSKNGLPVGLLIVGRPNREADLVRFAFEYERVARGI